MQDKNNRCLGSRFRNLRLEGDWCWLQTLNRFADNIAHIKFARKKIEIGMLMRGVGFVFSFSKCNKFIG